MFSLGAFSIRNFNLHNLKSNGNAPAVCVQWIFSKMAL